MIEKQALQQNENSRSIRRYEDIQEYREKHLCGKYEPLREHYETKVPYSFWTGFYQMLKRVNTRIK